MATLALFLEQYPRINYFCALAVDNNRVYFQLAIVLNHLVSGINALRLARQHNKQFEEQKIGLRFDAYRESKYSRYMGFNLTVRF